MDDAPTDRTTSAGDPGLPPPQPLRQYALLADGERGAIVGPRGDIAFLCAPRWHDDAVFSALLGGGGLYEVTPRDPHFVWGGYYEQDTLVWRSRWITTDAEVECREALAFPGDRDRLVLLRRVVACTNDARVRVALECRAGFGAHDMDIESRTPGSGDAGDSGDRPGGDGTWQGRSGDLHYRWSGAPASTRVEDGRLVAEIDLPEGGQHDLVLEISREPLPDDPPDPDQAWESTARAWQDTMPDLGASAAPGESQHSYAVLRGLTSATGGMVAAATTALPERAEQGRNYDYRYAWIRDQCFAGQAAAAVGAYDLLDSAVRFVSARVRADGADLRPAYTVDGDQVPDERTVDLPGYPGAPVRVGNRANKQFQLDAFGEALLLLAKADSVGRLDEEGWGTIELLVEAVEQRHGDADAGIWELEDRRWAHSRLQCAAGLRAAAVRCARAGRGEDVAAGWEKLADRLVDSVDGDCLHPSGRWQRSPEDEGLDAALLLPGIRGALPADDPRVVRTHEAIVEDLTDDGYVYRFRQFEDRPLYEAEGAFVLSGFHLALSSLVQGDVPRALRWFERNRSALGPPGLFAEEYDVIQRQLRGNLPQAFVHALLLETAHRLGEAGVTDWGFKAERR